MKVQELKLENIISYRGEKLCKVDNIGHYFSTIDLVNELQCGSDDMREYKPVPLTEEWLLKFGFVEHETLAGFGREEGRKGIVIGNAQDDDFVFLYRSDVGLNYEAIDFVDYVHQLQNLYFALTGEELIH